MGNFQTASKACGSFSASAANMDTDDNMYIFVNDQPNPLFVAFSANKRQARHTPKLTAHRGLQSSEFVVEPVHNIRLHNKLVATV